MHQDQPRQDNTFLILCQGMPPNSDRARPPNSESARRPDHCDDTRPDDQDDYNHQDNRRPPGDRRDHPTDLRKPLRHHQESIPEDRPETTTEQETVRTLRPDCFPPCVGGFHLHGHGVSAGFNYTQCQCKNPIVSSTLIGDIHLCMGRASTSIHTRRCSDMHDLIQLL